MKFIFQLVLFVNFAVVSYGCDVSTFVVLSKQEVLHNKAEIIANNIANSETPGFKQVKLLERKYSTKYRTKNNQYVNDISIFKNMDNGTLTKTANSFDFAIMGDGFFMVSTPNGVRYTRAGNFTLDSVNNITTADGYNLLDINEVPINVPLNTNDIMLKEDGLLIADGVQIGRVGVAFFEQNQLLKLEGKSLYKHQNDEMHALAEDGTYKLVQGFLESSNVNKVNQLTELIEVQRDVQLVSGLLNTFDDLGKNVIGKLGKY